MIANADRPTRLESDPAVGRCSERCSGVTRWVLHPCCISPAYKNRASDSRLPVVDRCLLCSFGHPVTDRRPRNRKRRGHSSILCLDNSRCDSSRCLHSLTVARLGIITRLGMFISRVPNTRMLNNKWCNLDLGFVKIVIKKELMKKYSIQVPIISPYSLWFSWSILSGTV